MEVGKWSGRTETVVNVYETDYVVLGVPVKGPAGEGGSFKFF